MAKLKTRDLILDVALILFNDRGEGQVSCVDLAHEMNISPGNLYYHFKGKEAVVEEIYARFHASLSSILDGRRSNPDVDPRTVLAYFGVISDVLMEYRFISLETLQISDRFPSVKPQLSRLLTRLYHQIEEIASHLTSTSRLPLPDKASELLADNIITILLNIGSSKMIINDSDSTTSLEDQVYLLLLPFLRDELELQER
jgi:Transcriptional regulator